MEKHKAFLPVVLQVEIETFDSERIKEHLKKVKHRVSNMLIYYETKEYDRVTARFQNV